MTCCGKNDVRDDDRSILVTVAFGVASLGVWSGRARPGTKVGRVIQRVAADRQIPDPALLSLKLDGRRLSPDARLFEVVASEFCAADESAGRPVILELRGSLLKRPCCWPEPQHPDCASCETSKRTKRSDRRRGRRKQEKTGPWNAVVLPRWATEKRVWLPVCRPSGTSVVWHDCPLPSPPEPRAGLECSTCGPRTIIHGRRGAPCAQCGAKGTFFLMSG